MLVLSRKNGESVFIGENIEVHVLEIRGSSVRLGFTAPRDVSIIRSEIQLYLEAAEIAETSDAH